MANVHLRAINKKKEKEDVRKLESRRVLPTNHLDTKSLEKNGENGNALIPKSFLVLEVLEGFELSRRVFFLPPSFRKEKEKQQE